MKVTVLGCGGSGGVPLIGGDWGNCDPRNPRNLRRRPSILLETDAGRILIDTSPDLRSQFLDAGIDDVDAILFTHSHADHCHGIDDLRPLVHRRQRPIDAYADVATMEALRTRFAYAFSSSRQSGSFYSAMMHDRTIEIGKTFDLLGLSVTTFEQSHGQITTLGYRIGPLGYSPDAAEIGEDGFAILEGIDLWIVDCLRYEPHPSHAHFERTMDWIRRLAPGRAILTHMNQTLDYDELAARCPEGVTPGHDGLTIELTVQSCADRRRPAAE